MPAMTNDLPDSMHRALAAAERVQAQVEHVRAQVEHVRAQAEAITAPARRIAEAVTAPARRIMDRLEAFREDAVRRLMARGFSRRKALRLLRNVPLLDLLPRPRLAAWWPPLVVRRFQDPLPACGPTTTGHGPTGYQPETVPTHPRATTRTLVAAPGAPAVGAADAA